MRLVYGSAIIFTLLIQSKAVSQVHDLKFEHLTVEQGLSSNTVWGIFQDSRGFMWFGTSWDAGLCKFDGYSFTVYKHDPLDSNSIATNNIRQIYEDRSGTLWLRAPGGQLNRFDRATGKFTRFLTDTPVSDIHEDTAGALWFATSRGLNKFDRTSGTFTRHSLSNDTLYSICGDPDDGRILWIGTARGLDRFDRANGTFTHYEHSSRNHVYTIRGDKSGMLWIGTDEGLYKFDKVTATFTHFTHYPVDKRISGRFSRSFWGHGRNDVLLIYEDNRGLLWIGKGDGLFRFEQATGTSKKYQSSNSPTGIANEEVTSIIEDRRAVLWVGTVRAVGTLGGGVGRYDRDKDKFTFYVNDPKDPQSLSNNIVTRIYEDRSGTLWIGTVWGGLNKLDRSRKAFSHYAQVPTDSKSLSNRVVTGLVEDRSGVLWVATTDGLNRFNRETETFMHYINDPNDPQSLGGNAIGFLLEDSKGTIWVGTWGRGLDRLDPIKSGGTDRAGAKFTHYTHDARNPNSLGSNSILSLFEDKSGRLWIGTSDEGLDEFDRNSGIFIHYKHDPKDPNSLGSNWVSTIYEDKSGTLWVGVAVEGLNKLDRAPGKFTHYECDPKNVKSLSYGSVLSIYEDSMGTLWIGTAAGLNRFERSTETFTHFTTKDGIANDFIGAILEDDSGCLWLKTGKGVSKFDPRTGTFRNYDASDGVNINPSWGRASYKNKKGEMFFGGTNGFIRFHPDSIKDNSYVPPIVITAFKKFDKPVPLDTAISEKKVLELSYRDDVFSFEFVALNYTSPEKNQYAYKLEGFDKDWVYCGTRRYASYTHLDGGTYVFRVKGSNNDGVWNKVGTSIAVIITPPVWETWWFRTIFFLTIAVSIGSTIRYIAVRKMRQRIAALEQQHALERERLRISGDLHDELASNLSSIAMFSRILHDETPSDEAGAAQKPQLLERITTLAQESVDSIRDIIWAIDRKEETLENLLMRLRDMVTASCRAKSIRCRFDQPRSEQLPSTNLPPEFRRHLWLLLREALNNALKHSGCTELSLCAEYGGGTLKIVVRDNGLGFDPAKVSKGKGLGTMKMRSEQIGALLELMSKPGEGTSLAISLKV